MRLQRRRRSVLFQARPIPVDPEAMVLQALGEFRWAMRGAMPLGPAGDAELEWLVAAVFGAEADMPEALGSFRREVRSVFARVARDALTRDEALVEIFGDAARPYHVA